MTETDRALVQWEEARRWFAKSLEDQRMARLACQAEPPLFEPAAFHCQQAAEKLLKGLLVSAAITIPKTHDLERLAGLVGEVFPQLEQNISQLSPLTPWGLATRYPDLDVELGVMRSDIAEAMASIDALLVGILALDPAAPK
jgi:HEPN domain-containing protein